MVSLDFFTWHWTDPNQQKMFDNFQTCNNVVDCCDSHTHMHPHITPTMCMQMLTWVLNGAGTLSGFFVLLDVQYTVYFVLCVATLNHVVFYSSLFFSISFYFISFYSSLF